MARDVLIVVLVEASVLKKTAVCSCSAWVTKLAVGEGHYVNVEE